MGSVFHAISASIPVNKFFPPVLGSGQILFRERLLTQLRDQGRGKRVIFLQAQAGQGKTTLAAQFLECSKAPFAWYQIGPEDNDPVAFLSALLACLMNASPPFRCAELEALIAKGDVAASDIPRCCNLLFSDFRRSQSKEFFLVFDDLHLLSNASATLKALAHIIKTTSPSLRFILSSRHPVLLDIAGFHINGHGLLINNHDLAMTPVETAELFHEALGLALSGEQIQWLQRHTEGWVMGLLLAAHKIQSGNQQWCFDKGFGKEMINDYFQGEIVSHLPSDLRHSLLKLSWLDSLPLELVEACIDIPGIGNDLQELTKRNFFVFRLDQEGTEYRFHQLFQEFLQQTSWEEVSENERRTILNRAAGWCAAQGHLEKALGYYIKAKNYQETERFLEEYGLVLYSLNRIAGFGEHLKGIPENIIFKFGWLSCFAGIFYFDREPVKALNYFLNAKERFLKGNRAKGELFAIAQIVYFHVAVDGQFHIGMKEIERAEILWDTAFPAVDDFFKASVSQNLAIGYCFFSGNMSRSKYFSDMAYVLAKKINSENLLSAIQTTRGFQGSLLGNYPDCLHVFEESFFLIHSPNVGVINKMGLIANQLDFYEMQGDFACYDYYENLLRRP